MNLPDEKFVDTRRQRVIDAILTILYIFGLILFLSLPKLAGGIKW